VVKGVTNRNWLNQSGGKGLSWYNNLANFNQSNKGLDRTQMQLQVDRSGE